jgi:hypothetical protein
MSNQPHFEVFPETRDVPYNDHGKVAYTHEPTGQFVWHFKDANGRITFTGGESFTRREDAHRSIRGVVFDVAVLFPGVSKLRFRDGLLIDSSGQRRKPPIVDLDENGDVVGSQNAPEIALADHLSDDGLVHLPRLAARAGGFSSSEGRRLLAGGALKLDGNVLAPDVLDLPVDDLRGKLLQVGNRRFARLR